MGYRKSDLPFVSAVSTDQKRESFGGGGPCPSYATIYGTGITFGIPSKSLKIGFFTLLRLTQRFGSAKQASRSGTPNIRSSVSALTRYRY